jgi:serine/threonine protein kinase
MNKNLEISGNSLSLRRHTDKTSSTKYTPITVFPGLEKVEEGEELDYVKGNELLPGHAGQCFTALNNSTGKVIIIKTVDFSELTKVAINARVEYLEDYVDRIKQIQNENIINYIKVIEQDKKVDIVMEFVPGGSIKFILNNFVMFKEKLVRSY